jgi:hypothetical protein
MEPHEFKKHSRIGTVLSVVGIVIILISIFIFIFTIKGKDEVYEKVKLSLGDSRDSVKLFESIIEKEIIECTALPLNQKMSNGNPIYRFTIRISDSLLIPKLSSVGYYFSDASFDPKLKTSSNPSNNFSISYNGWGCMTKVPVYLNYRNGNKTDTIIFPMCEKTKIVLSSQ